MALHVEELKHPVRIPKPSLIRHKSLLRDTCARTSVTDDDKGWLASRDLNQSSLTDNSGLSNRSALNSRYVKAAAARQDVNDQRHAPPPPLVRLPSSSTNRLPRHSSDSQAPPPLTSPGRSRDGSSPVPYSSASTTPQSKSNVPPIFTKSIEDFRSDGSRDGDIPLSEDSRMNRRYNKPSTSDSIDVSLSLPPNKLNQRYLQKGMTAPAAANGSKTSAHNGVYSRKQQAAGQKSSDGQASVASDSTDPVQWITENFDPVLNLDDSRHEQAQALASRMKGLKTGGKPSRREHGGALDMVVKRNDDIINGAVGGTSSSAGTVGDEERAADVSKRLKGGGNDGDAQGQVRVCHMT